jgi:phosphopantothenoylcysteine synthetase/decarboxylase
LQSGLDCWNRYVTDLCTLVVCGAPLAARAPEIAAALVAEGWRVQAVATPSAAAWVDAAVLAEAASQAVRAEHRPVGTPRNRERPAAVVVAPITFNTVGKLACGIADTYAHSTLGEALGDGVPILAVPMVNNRLWGNHAWARNVSMLSDAGVRWLSVHDGTVGEPEPVLSGTGEDVVKRFDPRWIAGQLRP